MLKIKKWKFTLIEFMIIISIIAIIFSVILNMGFTTKEIHKTDVTKVMVTTSMQGYNTYTVVLKNGDTHTISKKQFGRLVAEGVEVIK